jgi:hypothetical protein
MKTLLHPITKDMALHQRFNAATLHMKNYTAGKEMSTDAYDIALGLVRAYFTKFPEDPDLDIIMVEQQLSRVLIDKDDLQVTFEITMDAIGRTRDEHKRLGLVEHKSTSGHGDVVAKSVTHGPQVNGFAWVAERNLKEPVELVFVNWGVKTKKPRAERDKVLMNSNRINKWETFARTKAQQIAKSILEENFEPNHYHCNTIRSECDYRRLCWHGENEVSLSLYREAEMDRPTSKITF